MDPHEEFPLISRGQTAASEERSPRWLPKPVYALGAALVLASAAVVATSARGGSEQSRGSGEAPATPLQLATTARRTVPHIVFVLADDLGWNDIGYQSTDLGECTPFLDQLAADGIKLTNYYTQQSCTPSRAALMTGKYPIRIGMQHGVIMADQPWGLSTDEALLPQYLQDAAGYATHIIGKWHLGHYTEAHLPQARGFDTFFGYYSGYIDYFDHRSETHECVEADEGGAGCFFDWQTGSGPAAPTGEYSTYEMAAVADDVIRRHDASASPLFLYLALPNVHEPLQAPERVLAAHAAVLDAIPNAQRRTFAAMLVVLDEAVANVTGSLRAAGLYDETLMVFASDNGANTLVQGSGSNWPLRGQKGYLFEGAYRVPAFVHSPLLPATRRGATYDGLFHVSDWLPTFLDGMLASQSLLAGRSLNGVSQWDALVRTDGAAPRNEVLYNIDTLGETGKPLGYDVAALRVGRWKLITNELNVSTYPVPRADMIEQDRVPNQGESDDVRYSFLFDLDADPTESQNLFDSAAHAGVLANLTETLALKYRSRMTGSVCCPNPDNASYAAWRTDGSFIGPWRDSSDLSC